MIVERNGALRRTEDHGPRHQVFRWSGRKVFGIRRAFSHGHIARGLHEACELLIRDSRLVHPEAVHRDLVNRLSVVHRRVSAASGESTARNPNHPRRIAQLRILEETRSVSEEEIRCREGAR